MPSKSSPSSKDSLRQLVRNKEYVAAREIIERDYRLHEGALWFHDLAGDVYGEIGLFEKACAEYGKAIKLDPSDVELRIVRAAIVLADLHDYDRAIVLFQEIMDEMPASPDVFWYLARAYYTNGVAKARRIVDDGLAQFPKDEDLSRDSEYYAEVWQWLDRDP